VTWWCFFNSLFCRWKLASVTATTVYTYDNANRLTNVGAITYTWDNNGNLLTDGVYTNTYDAVNRLITTTTGAITNTFAYNGDGARLKQTVNGTPTTYTVDLATGLTQVLVEVTSGLTNTYLYGAGRIAQQTLTSTSYFLGDGLGSVRQLADASGEVMLTKSYTPYGSVLSSSGSGSSAYGFTGEWTDNTGLVYLRARYYAPGQGRFISRDTWAGDYNRPLTLNGFPYVQGNPINRGDPSGYCWVHVSGTGSIAPIWLPDSATPCLSLLAGGSIYDNDNPVNHIPDCFSPVNIVFVKGALHTDFYNSCDAVEWVESNKTAIKTYSQKHGVPPALVAGILASEINFDTEYAKDYLVDEWLRQASDFQIDAFRQGLLATGKELGPGTANIHYTTWLIVRDYYQACGYDLGDTFLPNGKNLSVNEWVRTLLTPSGAVEGTAIVARFLADYRTGTGGQPNKTTHFSDLTTNDMAHIFAAYRTGIGGLTCFNSSCGYLDIKFFQTTARLGYEATQALPYFEYFNRYFSGK
jgi:RHS repeat-associated protein